MSWPDVCGAVVELLDAAFDVPVVSRRPDPIPERLVQVRQTGGSALVPARYRVQLDVVVWAPSEPEALDLAQQARGHLWTSRGLAIGTADVQVYSVVEMLAPRVLDDPVTSRVRSLATYVLVVRADDAMPAAPPVPVPVVP